MMILSFILLFLVGIIIGVFLDRIIPTKESKAEKEYIKIFKDAVEKDLEQGYDFKKKEFKQGTKK